MAFHVKISLLRSLVLSDLEALIDMAPKDQAAEQVVAGFGILRRVLSASARPAPNVANPVRKRQRLPCCAHQSTRFRPAPDRQAFERGGRLSKRLLQRAYEI